MRGVVVLPEAEQEIREAYRWYEDQRVGLGTTLLESVDLALLRIAENPYLYPRRVGDAHGVYLRDFPYGLYYLVTQDAVEVIAFFHTKRDPGRRF